MLIYLFLKKYLTLLYLLAKAQFTDKTRNLDIFYDINEDMDCRLERRSFMPNSTVCEVYKRINYFIIINIYILKDVENEISFNTYNGYDSMYAPLFYNEYKQLFYHDYFIGE